MALPTPNPQIQPAPKKGIPPKPGLADKPQLPGVTPSKVSPVAVVGGLALLYLLFR